MKRPSDDSSARDGPRRDPHTTGSDALAWAVSAGAAGQVASRVRARARRRRRIALGVSCAAAALALSFGMLRPKPLPSASPVAIESRTAIISMPTRQVLPDGSVVELKEGSQISTAYTAEARRIILLSNEAHFQVEKDSTRPFIVVANGIEVRAVGTVFNVQIAHDAIEVLVTEGRVVVEAPRAEKSKSAERSISSAPSPASLAMVDAGYRVAVAAGVPAATSAIPTTAEERDTRLAWRVPRLEFSNTPLREVIALFNKYGQHRLTLDPSLDQIEMSGALRANDVDSLLLLLNNEFSIRPEQRPNGDLALARR